MHKNRNKIIILLIMISINFSCSRNFTSKSSLVDYDLKLKNGKYSLFINGHMLGEKMYQGTYNISNDTISLLNEDSGYFAPRYEIKKGDRQTDSIAIKIRFFDYTNMNFIYIKAPYYSQNKIYGDSIYSFKYPVNKTGEGIFNIKTGYNYIIKNEISDRDAEIILFPSKNEHSTYHLFKSSFLIRGETLIPLEDNESDW